MDEWIMALITLGASTIVSTIISTIIKRAVEHKMDVNLAEQKELAELKSEKERMERKKDVVTTMREELKPIQDCVISIREDLTLDKAATTTSIRANLKQLRDRYKEQGYADAGDIGTWNELYDDYKAMGGNHFKAYVDQWKAEVNALPHEKQVSDKKSETEN